MQFPVLWQTVVLLSASNVFMTFAWHSHLKHLKLIIFDPFVVFHMPRRSNLTTCERQST